MWYTSKSKAIGIQFKIDCLTGKGKLPNKFHEYRVNEKTLLYPRHINTGRPQRTADCYLFPKVCQLVKLCVDISSLIIAKIGLHVICKYIYDKEIDSIKNYRNKFLQSETNRVV